MIKYTLKCSKGHHFESWFRSSEAFERLKSKALINCPDCADTAIEKALMTPSINTSQNKNTPPKAAPTQQAKLHKMMRKFSKYLNKNSEYVGKDFAKEARAIHAGDKAARQIHGEARLSEAKELIDEGIPVLPLPPLPPRKAN